MDWRNVPSLTALRAFEAAARLGSYSAAARELNVTHAAIAQNVRALETHFGRSLMERDGKGMALTDGAGDFAGTLTEAFSAIGTACRDLSDDVQARPLRVAVTPSFAANWLMPRIGNFWDQHPEIELEILPGMSLVDLRRDNVDVAIRYGRGGWPGVNAAPLLPAGHVVAASPTLIKGRMIDCIADLKGEHWLMDGNRSEERFWIAANGVDLAQEKVTVFATGQLSREAARAGLGVTVLPAPIAAPLVAAGELTILCAEDDSDVAYHILTRPEVISAPRDTFVKWLRSEAAGSP